MIILVDSDAPCADILDRLSLLVCDASRLHTFTTSVYMISWCRILKIQQFHAVNDGGFTFTKAILTSTSQAHRHAMNGFDLVLYHMFIPFRKSLTKEETL